MNNYRMIVLVLWPPPMRLEKQLQNKQTVFEQRKVSNGCIHSFVRTCWNGWTCRIDQCPIRFTLISSMIKKNYNRNIRLRKMHRYILERTFIHFFHYFWKLENRYIQFETLLNEISHDFKWYWSCNPSQCWRI